ncbi:MAG: sulfite exporter TauE/SafE family protein [Methylococcaceae bacterium]
MLFIMYGLLGSMSGLLSGLFGIGGGIILVPLLYWGFGLQGFAKEQLMIMAVATSLATIVPTSLSSGRTHHRLGYVSWSFARQLAPAIMLGALCGASVVHVLPVALFKLLVAGFQITVAITLLASKTHTSQSTPPSGDAWNHLAGWITGLLSSLVGIGGGTLSIPYMLYRGLTARQAVATSSVCGFPIALISSLVYGVTGWNQPNLPEWNLGYIHLPAFLGVTLASVTTASIGAWLAHRLPTATLKRGLGLMVGIVGTKLLLDTLLPG